MGFYWGQGGEAPLQGTNPALSAAKIAGSSYLAYWVSFEIKKAILHNEKQMTCRGFAPPFCIISIQSDRRALAQFVKLSLQVHAATTSHRPKTGAIQRLGCLA